MIWTWIRANQIIATLGAGVAASIVATVITTDAMPVIASHFGYPTNIVPLYLKIAIYVALFLLPWLVIAVAIPWLIKRLAILCVTFLAYGFRSWADGRAGPVQAQDLWNWISDQVLVAQGRHAFSIECIAFQKENAGQPVKVALLLRQFPGFKQPVYLWPGGRIRGVEDDLGEEAKKIFKRETGCSVQLIRGTSHDGEPLTSVDGNGKEINNWFSPPPFLVMHQNRPQKFGVPGHTALLYVGTLDDNVGQLDEVRMVDVERIKKREFRKLELWPDTMKSVLLAYEFWLRHRNAEASWMRTNMGS